MSDSDRANPARATGPASAEPDGAREGDARPRYRPLERFWPYPDLPDEPTPEELAALDPELQDALLGPGARRDRPFSFTLVFPRFEGPDFERAVAAARRAVDYRETGQGEAFRIRARFPSSDPVGLRDLFEIIGPHEGCEVLVDDRPVPYARELWLPLVWYLLPR